MSDTANSAAYLCQGCNLAGRLDLAALAEVAAAENIPQTQEHPALCSEAGVAKIRADIEAQNLTHVVLGACSKRAYANKFRFPGVHVGRANLREGVIWAVPEAEAELTQDMAADYMRMTCRESKFITPPATNPQAGAERRILVVGGGVAGMSAALAAAGAGYPVLLVEAQAQLGGAAAGWHQLTPRAEPFDAPQKNDVAEMITQVENHPDIEVACNTRVGRTSGAPGQFSVDLAGPGAARTENIGAIIQASGFTRYDANQLPELGYGKSADVVDQAGLEVMASAAGDQPICRPSDGKPVESVVFVQCAGQRSEAPGHLPYCSGFCCEASIKQAFYFKQAAAATDVHIIYRDLRLPGAGEDFYRAAQEAGVIFTNGEVREVRVADGTLRVALHDRILAGDSELTADLVVLATGLVANAGAGASVAEETPGTESQAQSESETESESSEQTNGKTSVRVAEPVLNLDYRQGPDLPHLKHGFSDSHFICFPYETRRSGIYAAGPARRPMNIAQAREDAEGAAMKAITATALSARGRAVHPRVGDLSFPEFRRDGCTQCKRCTVECPFGAIDEDEAGYPQFNEGRCRRCGTCMGACPVRVISFANYSVDTVGQQIKAVDMPDEFDEKPRILILACENDAYPALDLAAERGNHYSAFARVIPVRCLGSVNQIWITDALNAGYDGVMLMGCRAGDDYQCHFVRGSQLATERMSKIEDTLNQLQLEAERVQTYEVEITDIDRVARLINEYAEKVEALGPNPFKDFN